MIEYRYEDEDGDRIEVDAMTGASDVTVETFGSHIVHVPARELRDALTAHLGDEPEEAVQATAILEPGPVAGWVDLGTTEDGARVAVAPALGSTPTAHELALERTGLDFAHRDTLGRAVTLSPAHTGTYGDPDPEQVYVHLSRYSGGEEEMIGAWAPARELRDALTRYLGDFASRPCGGVASACPVRPQGTRAAVSPSRTVAILEDGYSRVEVEVGRHDANGVAVYGTTELDDAEAPLPVDEHRLEAYVLASGVDLRRFAQRILSALDAQKELA